MAKQSTQGRPKKVINASSVKYLAAQDLSIEGIAKTLGCSKVTLYEHFPNGKLQELVAEGQAEGVDLLLNMHWRAARAGDTTAQRFLLSKRHPKYAVKVQVQGEVQHTHQHTHTHLMSLSREERLQRIEKLRQELQLPSGTIIDAVQEKKHGQQRASNKASSRTQSSKRKGSGAASSSSREEREAHA